MSKDLTGRAILLRGIMAAPHIMSKRARRSTANYEKGEASVDAQHNMRKAEEAGRALVMHLRVSPFG